MEYEITQDEGAIDTPFNLELILRACPRLYAKWKERPFFLDVDHDGKVFVVYLAVPNASNEGPATVPLD